MYHHNNLEVPTTNNLPFEYKILEWRLIINRELYENNIINLKIFSLMETSLITRMNKIKANLSKNTQ